MVIELSAEAVYKFLFFVNKPKKIRNCGASDLAMFCKKLFFVFAHLTVFVHPLRN